MGEIEIGDILVCINIEEAIDITLGKDYKLIDLNGRFFRVVDDTGVVSSYSSKRFKLSLSGMRDEKIDEILS